MTDSLTDVNFCHSSQYCKVSLKLCTKNAWRAATELAERVDGEPAPSGFLTCNVTPNEREQFLWDEGYLEKFISNKSETGRLSIPGHGYYGKLDCYYQIHFKRGDLYLEYLKGSCEEVGELCNFCVKGNGSKTYYVPRPYPDYNASGFHYLPGRKTPLRDEEGNLRVVDDFQPRAALKNLHQQDTALTSSDEAGIFLESTLSQKILHETTFSTLNIWSC